MKFGTIEEALGIAGLDHIEPKNLKAAFATLKEGEQKILEMRFGLGEGRKLTLEEVGKTFAVTGERIRQIEAEALRKLRHPSRGNCLFGGKEQYAQFKSQRGLGKAKKEPVSNGEHGKAVMSDK